MGGGELGLQVGRIPSPRLSMKWDGLVVYQFDTAWSPPMEFVEEAAKQFPVLTILLDYEEQSWALKESPNSKARRQKTTASRINRQNQPTNDESRIPSSGSGSLIFSTAI